MPMTKSEEAAFYRGFGAAIATLIRSFDLPTVAVDIAKSNGLGLKHFKTAKTDEFDLKPISKAFKDNSPA